MTVRAGGAVTPECALYGPKREWPTAHTTASNSYGTCETTGRNCFLPGMLYLFRANEEIGVGVVQVRPRVEIVSFLRPRHESATGRRNPCLYEETEQQYLLTV